MIPVAFAILIPVVLPLRCPLDLFPLIPVVGCLWCPVCMPLSILVVLSIVLVLWSIVPVVLSIEIWLSLVGPLSVLVLRSLWCLDWWRLGCCLGLGHVVDLWVCGWSTQVLVPVGV